ncbi:MAG TPA: hypothetical protein VJ461_06650 [Candidatus Nanoarchaeia archaeon]|nr:hypothetical protein [Candidatus Nanoarchaeia archaeon]
MKVTHIKLKWNEKYPYAVALLLGGLETRKFEEGNIVRKPVAVPLPIESYKTIEKAKKGYEHWKQEYAKKYNNSTELHCLQILPDKSVKDITDLLEAHE